MSGLVNIVGIMVSVSKVKCYVFIDMQLVYYVCVCHNCVKQFPHFRALVRSKKLSLYALIIITYKISHLGITELRLFNLC